MSLRPLHRQSRRLLASFTSYTPTRHASRFHDRPPPFPTIESCPSPTCACTPMPAMPEGFEIDHSKPLNGSMPAYSEQVLICTGKNDWVSKIEEENGGDNLAADLKELLGRGGTYSDPYHNISMINSSFPPSQPSRSEIQTTSAYLFPSFKYVPFLPRVSFDSVQALVKGYLLPTKLHPMHHILSPIHKDRLLRSVEYQSALYGVKDVEDILVLICGHGGRDLRCGILGPILQTEFENELPKSGVNVVTGPVRIDEETIEAKIGEAPSEKTGTSTARVGVISHIGGHKFAGNTIIYIPPKARLKDGNAHPLAGTGIWYGRVEPKHVQGIVVETILGGKVIADLFRGGIKQGGEILRM